MENEQKKTQNKTCIKQETRTMKKIKEVMGIDIKNVEWAGACSVFD